MKTATECVRELKRHRAIFSPCGQYRYGLYRTLSRYARAMLFVMLNPSIADGQTNDNTIRRCVSFARREGCGDLFVVNMFAWRATKPADLFRENAAGHDIVGPETKGWIRMLAGHVTQEYLQRGHIVCAWGPQGTFMRHDQTVLSWLSEYGPLSCLGFAQDGSPRHPLMLPKDAPLLPLQ